MRTAHILPALELRKQFQAGYMPVGSAWMLVIAGALGQEPGLLYNEQRRTPAKRAV